MQLQSVHKLLRYNVLVCILTLSPFTSYGQEDPPKDHDTGVSLLGFVDIEFCDLSTDGVESTVNGVTYTLEKGATRSICYNLTNSSKSPIAVKTHFVDGAITIDSTHKRSCKSNEFVGKFGQYVSKYDKLVTIPPRSSIKQQASLRLPDDYIGHLLGCLAVEVFVPNAQQKQSGLFDIVLRKAKFIDAIVDGKLEPGFSVGIPSDFDHTTNLLSSPPFFLHPTDSGKLSLSLGLNNTGQVDEQAVTTIHLYGILGQEIGQQTKETRVEAASKQDVQFEIPSFPWYKGLFSIAASVEHTPNYNFESEFVTEDMKQKQTITLEPVRYTPTAKRVSIFGRLLAIIVILIIVLLWRRKKKNHDYGLDYFPPNVMYPGNMPQNPSISPHSPNPYGFNQSQDPTSIPGQQAPMIQGNTTNEPHSTPPQSQ